MPEVRYIRVNGELVDLPEIPDVLIEDRDPVNPRATYPRGMGERDGIGRLRHPMYQNDMPQFNNGAVMRWEAEDTTLPGEPQWVTGPIMGEVPE